MNFDDLRTDIDLECPHCNRKFQQTEDAAEQSQNAECPGCGEAVAVEKAANQEEA